MLQGFNQFVEEEQLISADQRVLLAISGGMDSICMGSLFLEAGISFGVAHCNFGLRGIASDGDEYFVKEWAANAGVAFYSAHFDTTAYAEQHGISIQMAARELRYQFFTDIALQKGFELIATAHHRDDAIETFFINLYRGTGISGIKGIAAKSGNLIRPMLFASRAAIETYINTYKIKYRHDASNDQDKYLRNRIRHTLIPALHKVDADFPATMTHNMHRFREADKIYQHSISEVSKGLLHAQGDEIRIPITALMALRPLETWVWEILHPFGFSEEACADIRRSAGNEPGKIFLSATHRLLVDRKYLILQAQKINTEAESQLFLINSNDKQITQPFRARITYHAVDKDFVIPQQASVACLDTTKLTFPLTLRKWKQGDVFHPLGARGKKKLSDFFSDHKFSLFDKEQCWLLLSEGRIVWVVGHRIAHFARVTEHTNKVCILTLTED